MGSWFDKLLEELQQRQAEQDARREGRPRPSRARRTNGGDGDGEPPVVLRPRRPGGPDGPSIRRWVVIGAVLLALLFLIGFAGRIVNLVTDVMWYDALGQRDVLTTRLWSQLGLFGIGLVAFAIPALLSIWLARRIAPQVPIRRIGQFEVPDASRAVTWGLVVAVLLLALVSAGAWSGAWETILLFQNGGSFGVSDPNFGRDVGFYVFDLPFWRFLQGWAVISLVGIILLSLGAYAAGAMRWQFRLTAPVRAHLSILGALLLVAIAAGYQFDIAELSYSTRGLSGNIQAAAYTDMNAQVPAYVILTVAALAAAALLLLNIWFRTLWALVLAGAGWIAVSVLVGGIYPSIVQTFQVTPNERNVELPYIRNHIESTRAAFDLDAIEVRDFTALQPLTRQVFADDQATVDNLRLWDYRPLLTTFGQQQILRRYYNFTDVDIDRYEINGSERQIMLSARELDVERLADAARTWTNETLVYTHGYGITAVPVNAVTPQGQPDYLVSGINTVPQLPVGEPRIYFGEATDTYVVTGTNTDEFDYPLEQTSEVGATTTWTGTTGVDIGNPISRLLFALRFGDFNLMISNQLTSDSQILFRRAIWQRVPELAPFLAYDGDPYIVSADGRLSWVWDAYVTTNRYPDAQPLPGTSPFPGANYVRNSVKVVIDAYDGTVHFYVVDPNEPITAAYAKIFPSLFEPASSIPADLVPHLRFPEDLFTAQATAYRLYHLEATDGGATTFYNQDDRWAIPQDVVAGNGQPMEPYYVIMRIPGEEKAEFVLIQPMVPEGRENMIAWIAARMDPGVYGQRITFRFPSGRTTNGPGQVEARIDQDDTVSAQFTLWNQSGSSVIRGNLLVLPFGEDALVYVEPIFLQAEGTPFPEFVRIIMVSEDRVAFAESISDAIEQLLGAAPPPPDGGGGLPADVEGLVAEAQRLYNAAQSALAAGDLGAYQARIDDLQQVLDRLAELTGAATPAPSPTASP
jgi:uncharacterized membrane protein (UPF0182 family)